MPAHSRGDVVLVNYPLVKQTGVVQKVRPALVISDHSVLRRFSEDVMLAAITSKHVADPLPNEFKVDSTDADFGKTSLKVTSLVRLDFVMTVPASIINRRIGSFTSAQMDGVDACLRCSVGINT